MASQQDSLQCIGQLTRFIAVQWPANKIHCSAMAKTEKSESSVMREEYTRCGQEDGCHMHMGNTNVVHSMTREGIPIQVAAFMREFAMRKKFVSGHVSVPEVEVYSLQSHGMDIKQITVPASMRTKISIESLLWENPKSENVVLFSLLTQVSQMSSSSSLDLEANWGASPSSF